MSTVVLALLTVAFLGCARRDEAPAVAPRAGSMSPTASPTTSRPASNAPIAKLVIPSINVDRPVVDGTIDSTGRMVPPGGAFDVAYYTYSARPGHGNAVFSGHVDYVDVGPAVFWDLSKLRGGDVILIRLADGLELRYAVKFNVTYDVATGPWQTLFGAQAVADGLTLYTCDGDFDSTSHTYSQRRVVRAERVG